MLMSDWMVHAKNQTKILDGKITLYQRDDATDLVWQMRMRTEDGKGYVRRSTGETDLAKATAKALTIFGELQERLAQAIPLKRKTFAEIADSFERDVVCQPGTEVYLESQRKRGYYTKPDDLIFCHEDGNPIKYLKGFNNLLKAAGMELDGQQRKRTIYCLRHTYATQRLENGTNVYWLKQNMGTSVAMIEKHYGQTRVLAGIEHETAHRKMPTKPADPGVPITIVVPTPDANAAPPDIWGTSISTSNPIPLGAVDVTPVADLIEEHQGDIADANADEALDDAGAETEDAAGEEE